MQIAFIEVSNFRKLLATRIDFSAKTTIFVGANNSGKTSAMLALRRFLVQGAKSFQLTDFTLSHIKALVDIGEVWEHFDIEAGDMPPVSMSEFLPLLPALDVWLDVEKGELHHVKSMLPRLSWSGGKVGVRLRLQPSDLKKLFSDYRKARTDSESLMAIAIEHARNKAQDEGTDYAPPKIYLWPENLAHYLEREIRNSFEVAAFPIDPSKITPPVSNCAQPQKLSEKAKKLEGNPLLKIIRVNFEDAQRGMSDDNPEGHTENYGSTMSGRKLSSQLGRYHADHLDPSENPGPEDLGALEAIGAARTAFNVRIEDVFQPAFSEVQGMNYPGVTDPVIKVSSQMQAADVLNYKTSVSYDVGLPDDLGPDSGLGMLPENQNGLGYQNLISMVFKLMRFRDAWMKVGKAAKTEDLIFEPLHLVLLEEPEAHLHVQVQQVFIKKAHAVLRDHSRLGESGQLRTQLVVSTHSSHVAHETPFSELRYFRRLPAGMGASVPTSTVVNLKDVFENDEKNTRNFVTRYLKAQHSDLFFADAVILIEGAAERMLVPHFIRNKHTFLNQCFVSLLEINGSHAHKLKPLIEKLGLLTLVVTDIDAGKKGTGKGAKTEAVLPALKAEQETMNPTLISWHPQKTSIDELVGLSQEAKVVSTDALFAIRVAYQTKVTKSLEAQDGTRQIIDLYPSTFEDALVLENEEFFSNLAGTGLTKKFKNALAKAPMWEKVCDELFEALEGGSKASFALDVLSGDGFESLAAPEYISEGLKWLEQRLTPRKLDTLVSEKPND
ncbi:MAG: AAA family ATPase [Pseudoruegeria sp.]